MGLTQSGVWDRRCYCIQMWICWPLWLKLKSPARERTCSPRFPGWPRRLTWRRHHHQSYSVYKQPPHHPPKKNTVCGLAKYSLWPLCNNSHFWRRFCSPAKNKVGIILEVLSFKLQQRALNGVFAKDKPTAITISVAKLLAGHLRLWRIGEGETPHDICWVFEISIPLGCYPSGKNVSLPILIPVIG